MSGTCSGRHEEFSQNLLSQLHGFEQRLTSDVYPADFGWTPNWDEEAEGKRNPLFFETLLSVAEADWVHSSMQMDFDEETAFQSIRKLRDLGRRRTKQKHLRSRGKEQEGGSCVVAEVV